jgi:site-specific DNA recombinase
MRAIGYFRLKNGEGSLQDMEGAFADYCERYVHQPVTTFGDNGKSISGNPEYHRMLDYIRDSHSNFLIVVPSARHLGTDLESVARTMVELEATGSKVTCADDEMPDPLQNAFETLGVKGISRARSERIKESMRERALMGKGLGKPPYGYRNSADGTLEVVREEAAVVELIYRLYTRDGLGLRLIAQHLNERSIPTRRGGQWNMVTIRDILRNPTYMGTYTRFGLRLPKSHEAIIPPKVFREAQDQTRDRRPTGRVISAEPFLLSGMAYCGYCENKMMGVTRRQTWRRKDGRRARGVYRYYQCQSRNNQSTCEYHTCRAPLLEKTVLSHLKYALQARASANSLNGAAPARKAEVQAIWDARVKNAEQRLVQAMKRAAKGEMDMNTLAQYLEELDKARQGAESSANPSDVEAALANWESLGFAEQQGFLVEHIAKIVVQDNSVEVMV